jgi:hypothetical protein
MHGVLDWIIIGFTALVAVNNSMELARLSHAV